MLINKIICKSLNRWFVFSLSLLVSMMLGSGTAARASSSDELVLEVTKVDGTIALRHYIDVSVKNLNQWTQQPNHDATKFILYIDGTPLSGLSSQPLYDDTVLRFNLNQDFNKKSWEAILSGHLKEFFTQNSVELPVTVKQDGVKTTGYKSIQLTVIDAFWWWFVLFVISFVISIGLFWWLAVKSDIIRDTGPQPEGLDKRGKPNRKTFSLARTQMAFWFFSIVISCIFIWMLTSELPTLTAGVLGLMGISAATGLGAAVVDSGKRSDQDNERRALEEKKKNADLEVEKLTAEIDALNTSINSSPPPADLDQLKSAVAAKEAERAAKKAEIDEADQAINQIVDVTKAHASNGFLNDILSDDDGVSFHRFQILVWTIVLILIFLAKVYHQFSMPEFEGTLLALMGISAGTYIGFKLPSQPG
jgi:hypothetical protein